MLRASQIGSSVQQYADWCSSNNLLTFPPSYHSIASFLIHYSQRLRGSTRSLANVKSHLRVHCRLSAIAWLSESDAARLLIIERSLKFEDYSSGRCRRPLVMSILIPLVKTFDFNDHSHLLLATTLFLGHDGLLRGGEIWSNLTAADIQWHPDRNGFALLLARTKTHRVGGAISITYREAVPGAPSAVSLMRLWFDSQSLWVNPAAVLFKGLVKQGKEFIIDVNSRGDKDTWVACLRLHLGKLGLNEKEYAGHSLRAGGATDLFNSGMLLASVMKLGRWESVEAALLYFRDDRLLAVEAARLFAQFWNPGDSSGW